MEYGIGGRYDRIALVDNAYNNHDPAICRVIPNILQQDYRIEVLQFFVCNEADGMRYNCAWVQVLTTHQFPDLFH